MTIQKPKFIIFDYGNTLVEENVQFEPYTFQRIYDSLIANPKNLSLDQVYRQFRLAERSISRHYHRHSLEFRYTDVFRYVFTNLGLRSSLDYETLSLYYLDDYAPGRAMEGAKDLLAYLDSQGIESGVLSNLSYSSNILKNRLDKLISYPFKFVMASSEWIYKKPHPQVFNIALELAGHPAQDCWYIGDNPLNDVIGPYRVGIRPVYFDTPTENVFLTMDEDLYIDESFLRINKLVELIDIIKEL